VACNKQARVSSDDVGRLIPLKAAEIARDWIAGALN
jgi:hypothetical protein